MHEQNFLSTWLRKDGEKKGRKMEADRETKEEIGLRPLMFLGRERIRRVVVTPRSDIWDEFCGVSDCDSVTWTSLLVVNDVPVSPFSPVAEMCEGVSSD